jgi:hypothetical protein
MRINALLSLSLVFVAGVGAALAGCGEEPVPGHVTYERDVKPLLEARCVRCHGAGGMLNKDPGISDWVNSVNPPHHDTPQLAFFNTQAAAKTYANGAVKLWIDKFPMPPPPAPRLTSREREILLNWAGD